MVMEVVEKMIDLVLKYGEVIFKLIFRIEDESVLEVEVVIFGKDIG